MFISAAVNRIINWFNSMFLFIVSLFDEVAYIDKTTKLPTLFSLPLLGHTYLFMCGKYSSDRLTEAILDISKKLGPRFFLNVADIKTFITILPEDAQKLFKVEGKMPERPSFEALINYRQKTYNSIGCVPANGPEWHHYRQGMNMLLKKGILEKYEYRQRNVAKEFVEYINKIKKNDKIDSIYEHIMKYTIEAITSVCICKTFDCLNPDIQSTKAKQIIKASNDFMTGLFESKMSPLWKLYQNSAYKKIISSHETIHKFTSERLEELKRVLGHNPGYLEKNEPFIFDLLTNDSFDWNDKVMIAMEIFFGGIDATATIIAFAIYHLAKNKAIQDKARLELIQDNNNLFLKGCIKETMRLNPTSGAVGRILQNDENFGNYTIPKGTLVLPFASVTSLSSDYVEDPFKFDPNRKIGTYTSLPFGHGVRMCPGRKLALQEVLLVLEELLKRFEISLGDDMKDVDVGMVYRLNRIPDRDISVVFKEFNL